MGKTTKVFSTQRSRTGYTVRRRGLALLLAALLLLLTGCGFGSSPSAMQDSSLKSEAAMANKGDDYGYSGEEGAASVPEAPREAEAGGAIGQPPSAPEELGRKIIREGRAELETLEFETTVNSLFEMVADKGGFVESQSIQGGRYNYSALRQAGIVIRVPSDRFDEVMNAMESLGTVVQKNSSGTDITDQYADTESRVRNLKVQETRILELISKAEKLEEIVTLEARLSDLRYQIESYENSLKNFDRLLSFSRISLNINEVQRITEVKPVPKTLGERITQAFDDAWTGLVIGSQDFAVWVVQNMFTLIFLLLAVLVVWRILRASRRKRRKEKQEWLASRPPQTPAGPHGQMSSGPPMGGNAGTPLYGGNPVNEVPVEPGKGEGAKEGV